MIASYAGILVGSFFTNRLFSAGFWAIDIVLLLAIAGVVIVLATDDRDPSTVLAWLFVVLLLPVLGLIAYFFIGRNFRRDSPRRRKIMAQMDARRRRVVSAGDGRQHGVHRGGHQPTSPARRERASRPSASPRAAWRRCRPTPWTSTRPARRSSPPCSRRWRPPRSYIHLMYLIWEQDELTAKVKDVLLDRLKAGVKVHILYDWLSAASATRRTSSRSSPPPAPSSCPATSACRRSTTATT